MARRASWSGLVLLALAGVATFDAAPSLAADRPLVVGEGLKRDTGLVQRGDIGLAQRRALDIDHVRFTHGPWGTVVRVFTKGDFQRQALRGKAALALVVRRRPGGPLTVIATRRPERGSTLRGGRFQDLATRVVGTRSEVDFLILAPPGQAIDIAGVEVKSFRSIPAARGPFSNRVARLATANAIDSLSVSLPPISALAAGPMGRAAQINIGALLCTILQSLKAAFANSPFYGYIAPILNVLLERFGCNPPPPPPPPPPQQDDGGNDNDGGDDNNKKKKKRKRGSNDGGGKCNPEKEFDPDCKEEPPPQV